MARTMRRIGLWLLAAGIPAAGLGVGWSLSHPVLAGALTAGYATLVAALRFTGDVAGKLRERWRDRVVDGLDRLMLRWLSRFGRRYRAAMLAAMRFVDLKGLSVVGFYTPELDEVFVDVSLERRAPGQVSGGLVPSEPTVPADRLWLGDLLNRRRPLILAVIGAPGSGKTTLLRHTTRRLCGSRRGHRSVPLLLYLRDHAAAIVADPTLTLPDLARQQAGQYGASEPPGWFEQCLRKGRCVVQLDGFDEVATQADRRAVATWVEHQVVRYPRNDFVITSRPHGYRDAPISGATVLRTRNFTDEQVTMFVRAWYLAVERQASAKGARSRAASRSADLLDRLKRSPELYTLTVNPLLLTMIANVHRERGALPGSRVDLYGEICQVVLGHRRTALNLPNRLDADAKKTILGGLAFAMMGKRTSALPAPDVLAEVRSQLRRFSDDLTPEWFLADVVANGMLIEREPGTYAFAHLTLQEHLTATHIRATGAVDILIGNVDDTWWRETTLLYAAHSPAAPIVRACLDNGGTAALMLAFDCAEQDAQLERDLRCHLDDVLDDAFAADTDPDRRRVLAGVLVSRDLRQRIRIGDTAEVCGQPISNQIYALFGQVPASGEPAQPARGMWGRDVKKFVEWVNEVTSDGPTYRLPRREEIERPAVRETLAKHGVDCVWLETVEGLKPWTPVGTRMPHRIHGSDVERLVRSDLADSPQTVARLLQLGVMVTISYFDRDRAERLQRDFRGSSRNSIDAPLGLDRDISHRFASGRRTLEILDSLDDGIRAAFANAEPEAVAGVGKRLYKAVRREHKDNLPNGIAERTSSVTVDLSPIMGRALSAAVNAALDHVSAGAESPSGFARAFMWKTGMLELGSRPVGPGGISGDREPPRTEMYDLSPDSLAERIRESCAAFVELREPPAGSWLHHAIDGLREAGQGTLSTPERLTDTDATTARLLALCLASELDDGKLRRAFQEIAAGVTLRQLRERSEIPTKETIVLAVG
ncbi:NACHT domain-containing protein [Actinoallomurus iriomotensis]|uniref:NACHT domain-containing protein n=1 Tax=Actinoallomurus iriomotensis TaxID=478107 RepID=A0A9W6W0R9_9ACTN|nr:NACHT domain-containing protein [Actinoallomurus iriomotensis]GLY86047.1 hypothetical protein Airi02_039760 [Actinoallomurus iriomotensis]